MSEFIELMKGFNGPSIVVRLLLSIVLAGMIGFSRNRSGSPAGIKTHTLVSLGSCLIMLTSLYISSIFPHLDITRMSAQVISGIGFLGAGTILVTGQQQIKGLTSAAGIWFSASLGLAIGAGFYFGAIVSAFLVLIIFNLLNIAYFQHKEYFLTVYLEYNDEFRIIYLINELARVKSKVVANDVKEFTKLTKNEPIVLEIETSSILNKQNVNHIMDAIYQTTGVTYVREI